MGCTVIGIDIAEKLIELGKRKHPDLDLRFGDARRQEFDDNYFDIVFFSFNGLDYLHPKANRMLAIREISRVLEPSGLFVYSSHNAFNIPMTKMSIMTFLTNLLNLRIFTNYRLEKQTMGKLITYYGTIRGEVNDLKKIGFRLIDLFGIGGPTANTKNKIKLNLLSKHILYVFQKKTDNN
jgi:ubiquinone/menaquinone biosynthesis C-methylase UbiE